MWALKRILSSRSNEELKLVIMSATLNVRQYHEYFSVMNEPDFVLIASIPGRSHSIETFYLRDLGGPRHSYIDDVADIVEQIHQRFPLDEHILVFLPGEAEIEEVERKLRQKMESYDSVLAVFRLHSKLLLEEQEAAVAEYRLGRKVVLSTSIAESNVTVKGVSHVVDSLLAKHGSYDPSTRSHRLLTERIPRDSQRQRAGRAGRERAGHYYALCCEEMVISGKFPAVASPAIKEERFSSAMLRMITLGVESFNPTSFDLLDRPTRLRATQAKGDLVELGCIQHTIEPRLTTIGDWTARFPVMLEMAVVLANAVELGMCSDQICKIAAMAEEAGMILRSVEGAQEARSRFVNESSDHITLLNICDGFLATRGDYEKRRFCRQYFLNYKPLSRALHLRDKIRTILRNGGVLLSANISHADIRKVLFSGHVLNLARGVHFGNKPQDCRFICAKSGALFPPSRASPLPLQTAPWVFYSQARQDDHGQTLQLLTLVDLAWFSQVPWQKDQFYCSEIIQDLVIDGAPSPESF